MGHLLWQFEKIPNHILGESSGGSKKMSCIQMINKEGVIHIKKFIFKGGVLYVIHNDNSRYNY